jgi:cytochrome c biogenesis protein CcmG/thiol:disulfide interchange protein DsbE
MRWLAGVPIGLLAVTLAAPSAPSAAAGDPAVALGLTRPASARPAPDVPFGTPDDTTLRVSDFRGKVVFLNFWATWCKPCEEEMPGLERLYQRFKSQGLVVLAVSLDADGASVVRPFVARHKLTFPVGLDRRQTMSGAWGVWALPASVIIDRSGRRVLAANGPREWDGPTAAALIGTLLK